MSVITLQSDAVLVLMGVISVNGRMLQRFRHFVAGQTHPQGTLVAERITGTPLEQVTQLTLEQGLTLAYIQGD
jgi:hypothetical protein